MGRLVLILKTWPSKFLLLCFVCLSFAAFGADLKSPVTVRVKGVGLTFEEAQRDGFRKAILETYGLFLTSNTTIVNDDIRDEDFQYSKGIIEQYTEIRRFIDQEKLASIEMMVTVSPSNLARRFGLNSSGGALSDEDVKTQYQNAIERAKSSQQRQRDAQSFSEHLISDFWRSYFIVSVNNVSFISRYNQVNTLVQIGYKVNSEFYEGLCSSLANLHTSYTAMREQSWQAPLPEEARRKGLIRDPAVERIDKITCGSNSILSKLWQRQTGVIPHFVLPAQITLPITKEWNSGKVPVCFEFSDNSNGVNNRLGSVDGELNITAFQEQIQQIRDGYYVSWFYLVNSADQKIAQFEFNQNVTDFINKNKVNKIAAFFGRCNR